MAGQRVGAVRVLDAEGDLDGLGVDEGRAGMRQTREVVGKKKLSKLDVMPRRHVAGVACFQLVVRLCISSS